MLRYSRDAHRERLRQRLRIVLADSRPPRAAGPATAVDPEQREEWARRLMVRHCARGARGHSGPRASSHEFAELLQAFVRCCDPQDLRLVDVAHNAFEALAQARDFDGRTQDAMGDYPELLRAHLAQLHEGRIQPYGVDPGAAVAIEPHTAPLRALVLADNFLSASRTWEQVGREGRTRLRLLFCNNSGQPTVAFILRLLASLAALSLAGKLGIGISMLRGRPRVSSVPLADPSNTAWIRAHAFDLGLHNMGVIYRPATIAAFRLGILNAHIGHLPGMRGRSVFEWSLVSQIAPCVSTFFVDAGIDTGTLIVDRYVPPLGTLDTAPSIVEAKRRLFELDGLCYQRAVGRLLEGGEGLRNEPIGRRFYAMSELLSASIVSG